MSDICFGLIGEKLGHSISPAIHNIIFDELGIDGAEYNIFEVKQEFKSNIVNSLKTLGVAGANVTIPYKKDVLNQLDYIDDQALEIGAVNTIHIENGISKGYNTDYFGLEKTFEKMQIDLNGKTAVVLGNGGASKAVQALLSNNNVKELTVVTRADDWFPEYDYLEKISQKDIIINTTPVGMYPNVDNCLISDDVLKKFNYALDLIYNPLQTLFLKRASENGLITENGLYMLVYQAIYAQKIWWDREISDDIGQAVYEKVKKMFE